MSLRSFFDRSHTLRTARQTSHWLAGRRARFETLEDRALLSLTPVATLDVGSDPEAVVAADFNNDGYLDLVTANSGSNSVSVLLGNANGTFATAIDSPAGANPKSIAVGDFDDDGNLDLAGVSESPNPFVTVVFGDGDGNFLSPRYISLGPLATPISDPVSVSMSVAVGDFNEDRLMDIAVASPYNTHYPGYCCGGVDTRVQVILAHDDRTFSGPEVAFQSGSSGPGVISPLVVTDFNGDGHQDAVVGFDGEYVRILLGDGAGNLASASNTTWNFGQSGGMAVGDLNGDDVADLVAGDDSNVNVRLGNGTGGFEPPPGGLSYPAGDGVRSIALGDFDRDDALDVAFANYVTNSVGILRGRGDGALAPPELFAAGAGASSAAVADLNGDGWLDVAVSNRDSNNVSVLFNDGDWPAAPPTPPTPPPVAISVADASVTEGNRGSKYLTFTVSLSAAFTAPVTVSYATQNGTATAGSDYQSQGGVLTFAAGEATKTVRILITGDRTAESDESIQLILSNPIGNAVISDPLGIGLILNDDAVKGGGKKK